MVLGQLPVRPVGMAWALGAPKDNDFVTSLFGSTKTSVKGETMNLVGEVNVTSVSGPTTASVMPFEM